MKIETAENKFRFKRIIAEKMIGLLLLSSTVAVIAREWALDDATKATIVAGVGSSDSSNIRGILAASANGVGSYVQNYDGSAWDSHTIQAALLLDGAVIFFLYFPFNRCVLCLLRSIFP